MERRRQRKAAGQTGNKGRWQGRKRQRLLESWKGEGKGKGPSEVEQGSYGQRGKGKVSGAGNGVGKAYPEATTGNATIADSTGMCGRIASTRRAGRSERPGTCRPGACRDEIRQLNFDHHEEEASLTLLEVTKPGRDKPLLNASTEVSIE